ncbi:hypothetical protein E3T43_12605 [Cryobacterium sp. Hh7]|uniref:ATP-binding protein n=1 Tax=Cryobacterium sp. Hh7 TaxID=1259159 RepID=UPI001068E56C|nr:ATP-binding protein [Cryobacterium sp. Hh7]TFD55053.1 hypothetical protein E3T43_12605 [Cryobacterium sp. Hh7]
MTDLLALLDPDLAPRDDRPSQFTLTRFQLINWGTFKGFSEAVISPEGHLITGESGKGKSTLLDAMSAVMFAPKDLDFNAAARDAITKGRDRTLLTYVRGAYAQRPDEEGNAAVQYLRNGATWSALALEFTHPHRGVVTLVRIFRASESTTNVEQLTKVAMILERPFSVKELQDIVRIRLDSGVLKRKFEPAHIGTDFGPYQERYMRLFGIQSERALQLLQKTQAMKGLNTLDGLLKDFMLDEPETFLHADRAVAQFGDLRAAHKAVQTAREQRDLLKPLVSHVAVIDNASDSQERLNLELTGVARVRGERAVIILDQDLRDAEDSMARVESVITVIDARIDARDREIEALRSDYENAGGNELHRIGDRIETLEGERGRRETQRTRFSRDIKGAGFSIPSSPEEFHQLARDATIELAQMGGDRRERQEVLYAAQDQVSKARTFFGEAERELKALRQRPSNVPATEGEVRDRIAAACATSATRFPYVAELVQVRSDEEDWSGAIERVMHSFALSILVPREHYLAAAKFVNDNNLGKRVVFYPVNPDMSEPDRSPSGNSLIGKLDVTTGEFRGWVLDRLFKTLDYQCVDSVTGLDKDIQAVTRNGLERGRRDRHVKDDRWDIDNRSKWVLGFDNGAKTAIFEESVAELRTAMNSAVQARTSIEQKEQARSDREQALQRIHGQAWEDIDVDATIQRLEGEQRTLDTILGGNPALGTISENLAIAKDSRAAEITIRDLAVEERGAATKNHRDIADGLAAERVALASLPTVSDDVQTSLQARLSTGNPAHTVSALNDAAGSARTEIVAEANSAKLQGQAAHASLKLIFASFILQWPEHSTDVDDTFAALPEFRKILETLERDRLPDFEGAFRKLMQDGPTRHLTDLSRKLEEERRAIDRRIEPINDALASTEFNRGTHLKIMVADIAQQQQLQAFKRELRDFAQANALPAEDTAEKRYDMLSAIITRLGSDDPRDLTWKQQILDVRKHVMFAADELRGDEIIDRHTSGNGRSGGQRVKLVTFTLAAALRYQLTDGYGSVPAFAPVIIDEAFSKADAQFTEQSLQVFKTFGFQLILATPNKMLATFQHFVGGATIVHRADDTQFSSVLAIRMERIEAVGGDRE